MELIGKEVLGKMADDEKVKAYENLGRLLTGKCSEYELGKVPKFEAVQAVNPEVLQRAIQSVLHTREIAQLYGRGLLTGSVSPQGVSWKYNVYVDNSETSYLFDELAETESYRFANDKLDKIEGEIKKYGKAVKISKEAQYVSNWGEIGRQVKKLSDGGARTENRKIYSLFIDHYLAPLAKLGTVLNIDSAANAAPNAGRLIIDNVLTLRRMISSEPNPVPATTLVVNTEQEQTLLKMQLNDKIVFNFLNSVNMSIVTESTNKSQIAMFNVIVDHDMPTGYALMTSDPVNVGEFKEAWALQMINKPEELRDLEFVKASKAFGQQLYSYDTWGLIRGLTVI